jgi:alpha-mannosidase
VFNPHSWNRTDIIRVRVTLAQVVDAKAAYVLHDADEVLAPCQTTPGSRIDPALHPFIEQHMVPAAIDGEPPAPDPARQLLVTFIAHEVPALGYQTYYLTPGLSKHPPATSSSNQLKANVKVPGAENDTLSLSISRTDGSITLHHKPSGRRFRRLLGFEDMGDVGDEYNYSPPTRDRRVTSHRASRPALRLVEQGPVAVSWEVAAKLEVPVAADHAHSCRSVKTTQIALRSLVSLYAGVPRVDVTTSIANTAKDHRLRVLFPTSLKVDTAWADTPFYVNERSLAPAPQEWGDTLFATIMDMFLTYFAHQPPVPGKHLGWFEDSTTTHAQQTFVDVTDGKGGLMVASRGLPEYEVLQDPARTIAITLLRAIGALSRSDLTTRRGGAGPALQTPGAQCLGMHTCQYAIIPHAGTWRDHGMINQAHAFAAPLRALQTAPNKSGSLPARYSFLSIKADNLLLSALKKSEEGDAAVLRFYETSGSHTSATLDTDARFIEATGANLAEVEARDPSLHQVSESTLHTDVEPFQIKTVLLKLKVPK